jgi:hypothetical protein
MNLMFSVDAVLMGDDLEKAKAAVVLDAAHSGGFPGFVPVEGDWRKRRGRLKDPRFFPGDPESPNPDFSFWTNPPPSYNKNQGRPHSR